MKRLGAALVAGILAAGLILSTGEIGCPPGYTHAEAHDQVSQMGTCIGVESGRFVTAAPRVVWP